MSYPELLERRFQSGGAGGGRPLPGRGVSPQKLFFLLLHAAYGGVQKKKAVGLLPHPPSQGLTSPLLELPEWHRTRGAKNSG